MHSIDIPVPKFGSPLALVSSMHKAKLARPGIRVSGLLMLTLVGQAAAAERSAYFSGVREVTDERWAEHLSLWRSESIVNVVVSL